MQPELRLATEADIEETFQVYLRANEDLNRRIGRVATLRNIRCPPGRSPFAGARFATIRAFLDCGIDGTIGGFGLAIRRRSFWYLAALHVLPEFQGQRNRRHARPALPRRFAAK